MIVASVTDYKTDQVAERNIMAAQGGGHLREYDK
jgi:hypothetical protein